MLLRSRGARLGCPLGEGKRWAAGRASCVSQRRAGPLTSPATTDQCLHKRGSADGSRASPCTVPGIWGHGGKGDPCGISELPCMMLVQLWGQSSLRGWVPQPKISGEPCAVPTSCHAALGEQHKGNPNANCREIGGHGQNSTGTFGQGELGLHFVAEHLLVAHSGAIWGRISSEQGAARAEESLQGRDRDQRGSPGSQHPKSIFSPRSSFQGPCTRCSWSRAGTE